MANQEHTEIDVKTLLEDLEQIDEIADRVRLASFGLASPLLQMREAQMRREIDRVAAKKGEGHPEVSARAAALERTGELRVTFSEELSRERLDRPKLTNEKSAGVWGRVADNGKPVEGVTVIALANKERVDFRCTDNNGAFALVVPSESPLVLSIRSKEGAELYRDADSASLQAGEQQFREIDLTRGAEVPCPEPDDPTDEDGTFPMIDLVGQREADARAILKNQGLKLADRKTEVSENLVGRVLSQVPPRDTQVRRGDEVSIVVGISNLVSVPSVIGLTEQQAAEVLEKAGLQVGQISTIPVVGEKAGLVVNQTPVAADKVPRGEAVALQIGVEKVVINIVEIAQQAEDRLREQEVGTDKEPGFLALRLKEFGVEDTAGLEEFLKLKREEIRDALAFATLKDTDKAISALRQALKATER